MPVRWRRGSASRQFRDRLHGRRGAYLAILSLRVPYSRLRREIESDPTCPLWPTAISFSCHARAAGAMLLRQIVFRGVADFGIGVLYNVAQQRYVRLPVDQP
jgi:hypothetical protein